MKALFYSLLAESPKGFDSKTPCRHDLLGGYVVLLAPSVDEALSVIGDALPRVQGFVITVGDVVSHKNLSASLYHVVMPSTMLEECRGFANMMLELLAANLQSHAEVAEVQTEVRITRSKLNHARAGYDKTLDRLGKMVEELKIQKSRLSNILEGTNVGTWEWNVQTGELIVNEQWAGIMGYTIDELKPLSVETWAHFIHPDDLKDSTAALKRHFSGEELFYGIESRLKHKDGHWVWVLSRGKVISRTAEGDPLWMYGTHQDITERKRAEETIARVNQQLQSKNVELEQVLYVASHDLRAPLVNISGFAQELQHSIAEFAERCKVETGSREELAQSIQSVQEDIGQSIVYIQKSTEKMAALLAGLLKLSRLGRDAMLIEMIDMDALLARVASENEFMLRECGAKFELESLPPCRGDAVSLNQIFTNLLVNSVKFRAKERNLVIRVAGRLEGVSAIYSFTDNGIGIDPAHQSKIFEVFHRLNPSQTAGDGLGLSIVRQNLGRMNGRVWVESSLGHGSSFFISLPRLMDPDTHRQD